MITITDGVDAITTLRRPRAVRQPFPPGMAASVRTARVATSDLCGHTEPESGHVVSTESGTGRADRNQDGSVPGGLPDRSPPSFAKGFE